MRFCLAGSGPVGARPLGGFWDCTIMGTAEGPSACGQPSGLDVGYFQRIELVDGDGSSRFEKLAVDFDEGPISWLALCTMIIRLANQKTTVGHRSWYHVIQFCVVPFPSCFFPHRVLHFRSQSYAQHQPLTTVPSSGSLIL